MFLPPLLPLLLSCSADPDSGSQPTTLPPRFCRATGVDADEVEAQVDAWLDALDLDEKAGLMAGSGADAVAGIYRAGAVDDLGIPGFRAVDGPRGVSRGVGPATAFPVASMRGATWDPALERAVGRAIGTETRAYGGNTLLAPTINIQNHPRWGRAQETYGEDPLHVGDFGVAFIEGAQEQVLATAKHYAANNIEDTRFTVDAVVDERTLREIYLPQFRRAAREAHVAAFMSAYNRVNGEYASQNAPLLRDILRDEWGFDGFVMSDWLLGTHDTVLAIEAGLDLEMPSPKIYGPALADAVRDGDVDEALVDDAVRRMLTVQLCHGLDRDPPGPGDGPVDTGAIESAAHLELARTVAERGMVLLQNDGVLPIDRDAAPHIVVVGRLADVENIGDGGSSAVGPSEVVTAWEGLSEAVGAATIARVAGDLTTPADRDAVSAADVVIAVVGLDGDDEGEGLISAGDRSSLALSEEDRALLAQAGALAERLVVVLEGSSAITMEGWQDDADALVMAFYPGSRGGEALARVLYGEVNPSGRLSVAFPRDEADLPPFDNESEVVEYGDAHGYRWLDRQGADPLFPFGFGLSYTSWALAGAEADQDRLDADDTLSITVAVQDLGDRDGRATIQLYATAPDGPTRRYTSVLAAWSQVEVPAGGTTTASLTLPVSRLARWDVDTDRWVVDPGTWTFAVGQHHGDPDALPVSVEIRSSSGSASRR